MTIINRSTLRRGLVGGVFVAGLAAAGPAGVALAGPDDIDPYGISDTNTLVIDFGTQSYTWTDTTPFNAIVAVDDTTGKSTPVFNFPVVTETTSTLPGGEQAWGYVDENKETIFQGDTTTVQDSTSGMLLQSFANGSSEFFWDPFSSDSQTTVAPDSDTAPF